MWRQLQQEITQEVHLELKNAHRCKTCLYHYYIQLAWLPCHSSAKKSDSAVTITANKVDANIIKQNYMYSLPSQQEVGVHIDRCVIHRSDPRLLPEYATVWCIFCLSNSSSTITWFATLHVGISC